MLTVQNTEHFRIETPSIVTIGTFDGVHLGHQKILEQLSLLKEKTGLKTVVLTFDPHPRKVLFPAQDDLRLLTTVEEKLKLLELYGVDVTVVYPFTKAFSQMDSSDYISHILARSLNVKHLVIGYDHRFGRDRSGDIELLRNYSTQYSFEVEQISARDIDNIAVSSSKIRHALEQGNVEQASEYSGHPYFLGGKVVRGKSLGREIGYPTANIRPDSADKLIPAKGIYFVEVIVEGLLMHGMLSIGINPTTDADDTIKIEVHIFDFDADIYGKTIQVHFLKRLRGEKKFAGLEALRKALDEDRRMCLEILSTSS